MLCGAHAGSARRLGRRASASQRNGERDIFTRGALPIGSRYLSGGTPSHYDRPRPLRSAAGGLRYRLWLTTVRLLRPRLRATYSSVAERRSALRTSAWSYSKPFISKGREMTRPSEAPADGAATIPDTAQRLADSHAIARPATAGQRSCRATPHAGTAALPAISPIATNVSATRTGEASISRPESSASCRSAPGRLRLVTGSPLASFRATVLSRLGCNAANAVLGKLARGCGYRASVAAIHDAGERRHEAALKLLHHGVDAVCLPAT